MPHFIVGAQKKMVFGPAGWFQNDLALAAKDILRRKVESLRVLVECFCVRFIENVQRRKHLHRFPQSSRVEEKMRRFQEKKDG